ncbi:hypothetical protein NQ317_014182 [Molorchus minor]|uniref:Pop1 N-terminal domain-containing protein n=1 Tax=Molorchus minor TaxID=1323400 RepID=A0ABQ9JL58_9CUCU|nr:hypothetical protein NQ317_014182 [Molorchus minor]
MLLLEGKEIEILKKALSSQSGTKLAFQKLPKHMRRRAMSHNVKRLPRRLREIHMNQMKKSGLPPKQKRKYRRRPFNLLSDYMRRQRNHTWLDTHIWHAKRFHMIEKWGYRCVEIEGDYDTIVNNFKQITDPKTGLTLAAKCFANGKREGKVTIYKNDGSKMAIGSVWFNWRPHKNKKQMWIMDVDTCSLLF